MRTTLAASSNSKLLTFRSAASEYGFAESFLRHLRITGKLPVVQVGRRVFIERATLDAIIEDGRP